jgi:hypothetical protein
MCGKTDTAGVYVYRRHGNAPYHSKIDDVKACCRAMQKIGGRPLESKSLGAGEQRRSRYVVSRKGDRLAGQRRAHEIDIVGTTRSHRTPPDLIE